MSCYQQHMFPFIQQQLSNHLMGLLLVRFYYFFLSKPALHNSFPRSGSTCAQGICLCVSRQISPGQGLRLASSKRLLKTPPQHDGRGKWIFQLKSRLISAQGIMLRSKRLISKMLLIRRCAALGSAPVMFTDIN